MPLIEVGKKAPAFTLIDQDGEKVTLKGLLAEGRGPLVVYFYPKADTSSCTKQACQFNEALPRLGKLGVRVVGVSPDGPGALKKFAKKYGLKFPLLGDEPGEDGVPAALEKFGVWGEKSMYGKKYMGVIRTTYLLDKAGKVLRRWDSVKVPGHEGEVLEAVKELGG
jgi:thioredoxin-dependent peroxiredoxin